MLLAIDVGNTQTVFGLYDDKKLMHMWRVSTNKTDTSDELRLKIKQLLDAESIASDRIKGAALASVVPLLTVAWTEAVKVMFGKTPLVVDAFSAAKLFQSSYANLHEIGPDRVADAIAAKELYGSPVVVVDFGTATNIEVIDRLGNFVGGIIAPGIETSSNALFSHATRLAAIDLIDPKTAIGASTEEAIQAGIIYGEADRVDGLMRRVFAQLGYETPVIATGGLAHKVADVSQTITAINSELTLEGLRLIYESL